MSSQSPPQGVCLLIKYHGARASQLSATAPFNEASSMPFRDDLRTMRFPLPKTANIRLVSDTTIVAWWPDVSRRTHHVLYNHLINNTNTAWRDGHFTRLSISVLSVRDIMPDGNSVELASAPLFTALPPTPQGLLPPAKRARLQSVNSVSPFQLGPPAEAPQSTALPRSNIPRSFIPQVPQSRSYTAPQRSTGTNFTAQKRTWDGEIIQSSFYLIPPASSGALLQQQTHSLSSTRLPQLSVPPPPASNAPGAAAHRLMSSPSAAPTASAASATPAQASGLPKTQNQQSTQPPPDPTQPTASRDLRRQQTQVSSPTSLPQSSAPAPQAAVTTPVQATRAQPFNPSVAPNSPSTDVSVSSAERPATFIQGTSATRLPPNGLGVPMTQPASAPQDLPIAQSTIPTTKLVEPGQAPGFQTTLNRLSSSSGLPTRPATVQAQQQHTSSSLPSQGSNDAELEALRKRVKSMEEMLRTQMNVKVRLDETANKLQEEQEERKKLAEMLSAARESEADVKRRLHEVQRLFEEEGRRRSEADALVAATRREVLSYRESRDRVEQERDEVASGCDRVREELSHSRQNEDAIQHELGRVVQKLEQTEEELQEETDQRRRYQDRLASAESSEVALRQHCDEANQEILSLMRMRDRDAHDPRASKRRNEEALHRCEGKLRTQQIVMRQAEGAIQAAQSSEKALRSRLEEVESRLEEVESGLEAELETERRSRRETEDAIADIRRECREPFVVPSLMDAFVELAKLTTEATTSGMGKESEKLGDTPPTTDSAVGAASSDARTVAATTNRTRSRTPQLPQQSTLKTIQSTHSSIENLHLIRRSWPNGVSW